jgi:cellulose synthase/poly-beta-1,6-N-acetylglucosamine synthase-like glycosyltransferase
MSNALPSVSFVVAVHNGERWLESALEAILAQGDGREMEVLVVDDGSRDGSRDILRRFEERGAIRVLAGPGRGAAAAINAGVRAARYPIICQVDQDVIVGPGWMSRLVAMLDDPQVAAAQGYYVAAPRASVWARGMGLDLEERYARIRGHLVDHVCTGNTAYRAEALHHVGLFDESLGYGYDNDMSYRLVPAGYRLAFCREARSVHRWREDALGYVRQQYGVGFGRLDIVHKHRHRVHGDDTSGLFMILHAPLMLGALVAALAACVLALCSLPSASSLACVAAAVIGALAVERLVTGAYASLRFRDLAGLWFVPLHLMRDVAWAWALLTWTSRRLLKRPRRPADSMLRCNPHAPHAPPHVQR